MKRRVETGRKKLIALFVGLAVLVAPLAFPTAWADDRNEAKEHFTRGKQLYDTGKFRAAIAEFEAADRMSPAPLLQFNIGLCHERLGDRREALRRYRLYLEKAPAAPNRDAVEVRIARLEQELRAQAANAAQAAGLASKPTAGPSPPASATPKTGDAELDRVAAIDVGAIHAKRGTASPDLAQPARSDSLQPEHKDAAVVPPAGPPGPPPTGAPLSARSGVSGSVPPGGPPPTGASLPGSGGVPPGGPPPETPSKPIYKEWWFWVIIGVGALIAVDIAVTAAHSGSSNNARALPANKEVAQPEGPVLLRF
jgi:hypothetical protein